MHAALLAGLKLALGPAGHHESASPYYLSQPQRLIMKILMILMVGVAVMGGSRGDSMAEECTSAFEKLESCLVYATGKANAPSKECCSSVSGIKESDPACLCFIIQQAHNGSAAVKSTGIQETRLLLLPSSCHLNNASISNCPKLLNLAPNSTDAKIFSDPSFTNATTTPTTPLGTSSNGSSAGRLMKDAPYFPELMLLMTVAVLSSTTQLFSF